VLGDTVDEPNETYSVSLHDAVNASINDGSGAGTITDDDPLPSLSIADVGVTEGNSGTVNAIFTVSLTNASSSSVSVNFATADGIASAPADYTAQSGTLTFNPGVLTQTITVVVKGDTLDEVDETFVVNLSNPINATIGDDQGLGTIADD